MLSYFIPFHNGYVYGVNRRSAHPMNIRDSNFYTNLPADVSVFDDARPIFDRQGKDSRHVYLTIDNFTYILSMILFAMAHEIV